MDFLRKSSQKQVYLPIFLGTFFLKSASVSLQRLRRVPINEGYVITCRLHCDLCMHPPLNFGRGLCSKFVSARKVPCEQLGRLRRAAIISCFVDRTLQLPCDIPRISRQIILLKVRIGHISPSPTLASTDFIAGCISQIPSVCPRHVRSHVIEWRLRMQISPVVNPELAVRLPVLERIGVDCITGVNFAP